MIYNLQQEYDAATSGITTSRRRIDDTELQRLNTAMNAIVSVLGRLETTVDRLQNEGVSVNGSMNFEL